MDHVEVKDKRFNIHATENIKLKERNEPKSLKTPYQVHIDTEKDQKSLENENNELEVKLYSKRSSNNKLKKNSCWISNL